ncbi:alpha/beta fold hydrolase [Microbacterium sp. JZ31]|uniref:alpha/beta fold hydrolase n=1 Tax=Microbacterium sp. JZ31 TaxID=1906274 RepID=UPI0019347E69|nr:alpha/beta hydrolase [Microbacterium sp. JZ31]
MFYARFGPDRDDAPTVLLLHGGGVAGWMWESLRDHLRNQYRVLVVDLPGHGRSVDQPYLSHGETIRAIAALLRTEAKGRPATVVGFSLGAQLAILLASEHPALVGGVVVVSAQANAAPLTPATLALLRIAAPLARQRWFAKLQARELFIPPRLLEAYIDTSAAMTRESLLAAVAANMRFRIPSGWSAFTGRSVVMVGERERPLMRDSAAAIHAALPTSTLTVVDGCGHGIPLQRPEWFSRFVTDWLASASP